MLDISQLKEKYPQAVTKLSELAISASSPALTPGNFGSVSVKLDKQTMLIKKQGSRLAGFDIDKHAATVNFRQLRDFFLDHQPLEIKEGIQKTYTELLESASSNQPDELAGAHSLLGKYVLHSYSFLVNLACACEQGIGIITRCFLDAEFEWLWIPYNKQSGKIAFMIKEAQRQHRERREAEPQVFFLQNNGILISGDSPQEILAIQEDIHARLNKRFKMTVEDFPETQLSSKRRPPYTSDNMWLRQALTADDLTEYWQNPTFLIEERLQALIAPEKMPTVNEGEDVLSFSLPRGEAIEQEELLTYSLFCKEKFGPLRLRRLTLKDAPPDFVGR